MTTTHITRRAQLGELNTLYSVQNILIFNALLGLSVVDLAVAVAEAAVSGLASDGTFESSILTWVFLSNTANVSSFLVYKTAEKKSNIYFLPHEITCKCNAV